MKKLLLAVLAFVLLLPTVVKADEIFVDTFYNKKAVVDGEVELNTLIGELPKDCTIEYSYDPAMLSITPEMVSVSGTKVENGKVTVKLSNVADGIESYGKPVVNLRFTALKEGQTEIKIVFSSQSGYARSTSNTIIAISGQSECTTTEPVPDQTEPTEPTEPTKPTTDEKDETILVEETDKDSNNDLFLYISLGLNAVLLIAIIAMAVKGRKKVTE